MGKGGERRGLVLGSGQGERQQWRWQPAWMGERSGDGPGSRSERQLLRSPKQPQLNHALQRCCESALSAEGLLFRTPILKRLFWSLNRLQRGCISELICLH